LQYEVAVLVILGQPWISGRANYRKAWLYLAQAPRELISVHAGHHDIGENRTEPVGLGELEGIAALSATFAT